MVEANSNDLPKIPKGQKVTISLRDFRMYQHALKQRNKIAEVLNEYLDKNKGSEEIEHLFISGFCHKLINILKQE